jgi:hypothetical protein
MVPQDRPFILQLIQKIPDIKSWVKRYLKDGLETLMGHTSMHLFQFYVDYIGWLMMWYKVSSTKSLWSP